MASQQQHIDANNLGTDPRDQYGQYFAMIDGTDLVVECAKQDPTPKESEEQEAASDSELLRPSRLEQREETRANRARRKESKTSSKPYTRGLVAGASRIGSRALTSTIIDDLLQTEQTVVRLERRSKARGNEVESTEEPTIATA